MTAWLHVLNGLECTADMALLHVQHVEAALDRKEIVVARLKAMNDVAETGRHVDGTGRLIPAFEREYAQAILDLRDVGACLLLSHVLYDSDQHCCRDPAERCLHRYQMLYARYIRMTHVHATF